MSSLSRKENFLSSIDAALVYLKMGSVSVAKG